MLEASTAKANRMWRRNVLLPALRRAMRLYRRLSVFLACIEQARGGFGVAAGRFSLPEHGQRQEGWYGLEDLAFRLPWTRLYAPSAFRRRIRQTALGDRQSAVVPAGVVVLPGDANRVIRPPRQMMMQSATQTSLGVREHPWLPPSMAPRQDVGEEQQAAGQSDSQRVGALNGSVGLTPWARLESGGYQLPVEDDGFGDPPEPLPTPTPAASARGGTAELPVTARPSAWAPASLTDALDRSRGRMPKAVDTAASGWSALASQSVGARLGIVPRVLLAPFFPDIDLDEVRIHTDEPADRAARYVGAAAFSLGRSLFFRARRFNVVTAKGLALLGHELAHSRQVMHGAPIEASVRPDGLEHEAERTERVLQRVFALGNVPWSDRTNGAARGSERSYAPLSIELAQPFAPANGHAGSGGEVRQLAAPAGREVKGQPLKAEEGRIVAAGAERTAAMVPSSPPEDTEGLARTVLRSLERRIQVEKERRGVDRWAR